MPPITTNQKYIIDSLLNTLAIQSVWVSHNWKLMEESGCMIKEENSPTNDA